MAEIVPSSRDDSYDRLDDNDEQSSNESPGPVLDGPYAHIFLSNFQRQLQQSVNAGKKAWKNNKNMSHKPRTSQEIEPPKHEPPANPLPAEHLKSCIKKDGKGKKARRYKVTWAPDVYDPAPSADSHHVYSKTNSEYKKKERDVSDDESKKSERVKGGNKNKGDEKDVVEGGGGTKGGKYKDKIDDGGKGSKGKGKKWERAKSSKK